MRYPLMKTAASRFLIIFCLSVQPVWAANPIAETQKPGSSNASGLTGGGPSTGGNNNLGSNSLQPQQSINMSGTLGGSVSPAPTVGVNKTVTAAPVAPGSVVAPQADLTETPVSKTQTPAAQPVVEKVGVRTPAPILPGEGELLPEKDGRPTPAAAGKSLQSGVMSIQQGAAAEAAGMGEGAVQQALDKIFDASQASQASGLIGIPGSLSPVQDKIKKTVALANTSAPRNAPDLYVSAIKAAEDSFPAQVAGEVKLAVLGYAARKAATALQDLANEAYRSAGSGEVKEVRKAFASMDKWEKLLARPGEPLVANRDRLEADVERVLEEGTRAASKGTTFPAPRIWFARVGSSFNAVLPSASVASLPLGLAESLALKDALAPAPFYQQALLSYQARPTLANGFKLVYRAHRGAGRSAVGSSFAAASYGARSLLARFWHALKDLALRLLGRAPDAAIGRGFTVDAAPAPTARAETVSFSGAHLRLASAEVSLPSWGLSLEALHALQTEHALALALLSRETPLDLQAARAVFGLAAAMAANHEAITGEGSAADVPRRLSVRFEALAREEGLGPRSRLTAAMLHLLSDLEGGSLRQWLDRVVESAQERVLGLSGSLRANRWLSQPGGKDAALFALTDLGAGAPASKGRFLGAGLRAAARLFLDAGPAPQGSFAVKDDVVLGRWSGAQGSGKVLAVLAPAALGGGIRILFEHPSDVGAAARLLSGLGFSVETRGRALSASLAAEASDAGGTALSGILSRVVLGLQTGREPGPALSGPARGEASSSVRKLVSDLESPQAAAVAGVLQAQAPASLVYAFIGRVEGLWAQSSRLVLDDGRILSAYALRDPSTGLITAARAELSRPGAKPRTVGASELAVLLKGE
ncbi:MAG: hypothetical protein HY926_06865 [Elusimicrobia bacterium]|nr:hypothetical protein [Elusimicrobiota bacterium]